MPDFPLFPNVKFSTVITESDYGPLWAYVNHMGPTCTEVLQQMCDLVGPNWRGMFKDIGLLVEPTSTHLLLLRLKNLEIRVTSAL